jgi:NAD(P)-dependent dehydrogenase (short-subunit alcohol dehydrogenase family)
VLGRRSLPRASSRTDMMPTVNSVTAAIPYPEKPKSASIIVVSGRVPLRGRLRGRLLRRAIKAALIHYSKGLSQLVAKGIRVNVGLARSPAEWAGFLPNRRLAASTLVLLPCSNL